MGKNHRVTINSLPHVSVQYWCYLDDSGDRRWAPARRGKLRPGGVPVVPASPPPLLTQSSAPDIPDELALPPIVYLFAGAAHNTVNPTRPVRKRWQLSWHTNCFVVRRSDADASTPLVPPSLSVYVRVCDDEPCGAVPEGTGGREDIHKENTPIRLSTLHQNRLLP